MAAIDVGGALGSGFGLIRRRPWTVLVWGLLIGFAVACVIGGYVGFFATFALRVEALSAQTAQPSSQQVLQVVVAALGGMGLFALALVVMQVVFTVVTAAIWRSVLHPERAAWAYLRVGVAEALVFLLRIVVGFIAGLPVFALFPVMLVALGVAVAFKAYIAAVVIYVLGFCAVIAAQLYITLRFSLIGPMVVDDGKVHFVDAWRLTQGRVGSLLLVGLGVAVMLLAAELVLLPLAAASVALNLGAAAGGFDRLPAFFEAPPADVVWRFWPVALGWGLAAIPLGGALSAIAIAPWAKAYRDLAPGPAASEPAAPQAPLVARDSG